MGTHRLASLRHRQAQFERQLTVELSNRQPDDNAMQFFKTQKLRIRELIDEIEGRPKLAPRSACERTSDEPETRASA